MTNARHTRSLSLSFLVLIVFPFLTIQNASAQTVEFDQVIVDPTGSAPIDPWGKAVGDIDGDGLPDLLTGGRSGGGLVWYSNPDWVKTTIAAGNGFSTDHAITDVDGDGDQDVVALSVGFVNWFENVDGFGTLWTSHSIDAITLHDVEVGDFDNDGDVDLVGRDQSAFAGSGAALHFYRQDPTVSWDHSSIPCPEGEGLLVADVNADGRKDVVVNDNWYENTGDIALWNEHVYTTTWPYLHSFVAFGDINEDGRNDIVLAPAETAGELAAISWFEAPVDVTQEWTEHIIESDVEAVHHFAGVGDFDLNGTLDVAVAEMHQGANPDEIRIYLNQGLGNAWSPQVISNDGSHSMQVADIDQDGDLDLYGANHSTSGAANGAPVELWLNRAVENAILPLDLWQRHIIEASLPWSPLFVEGKDLNGDGLPDLVAGGWWYPNPGSLGGTWNRTSIGASLHNMATVHDLDTDGDLDILGTDGQHEGGDLYWAQNDGSGFFTVHDTETNVPGDPGEFFLQGVAVDLFVAGGDREAVVLMMHHSPFGAQMLSVPTDPTLPNWTLSAIGETDGLGEEVATGDIDGDGLVDIHQGQLWQHQLNDGSFETLPGVSTEADRVTLADIDGDGDLDVIVGHHNVGLLLWGENQGNGAIWIEHSIASDFSQYRSVDVADIDGDGDFDVVSGAHNANGEVFLYENAGQGASWNTHVVDSGSRLIDHHDGTQLVDMDLDGDLDIVSIGFVKQSVVIYENLAIDGVPGNQPPLAIAATVTTDVDVPVAITLQASDADGDVLSYSVVSSPSNGTLSGLAPDVTYTPNTSFNGADSFDFTVNDGNGGSDTATVSITVGNQPPVAVAASVTTEEDVAVAITLQASDANGDPLSYSVVSGPSNGTLSGIEPDLTYAPNPGFHGADSFDFTVDDGNGGSDKATISITVNPGETGLLAYWPMDEGAGTTTADTSGNGHTGTLVDGPLWTPGPGLSFDGVNDYLDVGTFDVAGSAITLAAWIRSDNLANCSPVFNDCRVISKTTGSSLQDHYFMLSTILQSGETRLRFRLKTGGNTTTLIANAGNIANDQWVHAAAVYDGAAMRLYLDGVEVGATAKSGDISADPAVPVSIGANPTNPATQPWDGQIDEVWIYERALSAQEILAMALGNESPVAVAAAVVTDEDAPVAITLLASDADGDILSYSVTNPPANGVLSGTGPDLTYAPNADFNGADSFDFQVEDGGGGSDTAAVSITVNPVNDAPLAVADSVTAEEDVALAITLQASDADGDALSYTVITTATNGVLSGMAPDLTYAPKANFNGADNFAFEATDGNAGSDAVTVSITVTPVNDPPVAFAAFLTTEEGVAVAITLQASDADGDGDALGNSVAPAASVTIEEESAPTIPQQASGADGDALNYTVTTPPANGVLSGTAPNLTYTPSPGFTGSDSFDFQVDDGNGGSDTATVSITVIQVNDPPVAVAASVTTEEDVAVAITLQASDADGDPLSYSVVSGPSNGTLSGIEPDLTYTPNLGFHGADSFDFTVDDGNGGSDTATISITVNPGETGLLAYWPMDEGAGTTTADASGNGHTGTLVDGPLWTPGPGLSFDGVNDYLDVGTFDVAGSTMTLAAWIRSDNLASCSPVFHDCRVISKSTGSSLQDHYFMLSTIQQSGETRLRFRLKTGGNTTTLIANAGNIANDQWVHAAAVYDGAAMRLYLDGVDVGAAAKSGDISTNPAIPVAIGANPTNPVTQPWDGQIDEVRIYDRALSAQEILAIAMGN